MIDFFTNTEIKTKTFNQIIDEVNKEAKKHAYDPRFKNLGRPDPVKMLKRIG